MPSATELPDLGPDWTRQPVAQLRYEPADYHRRLYCADRNSRWHYYDVVDPTRQLDELLAEIDEDPTGQLLGLTPPVNRAGYHFSTPN